MPSRTGSEHGKVGEQRLGITYLSIPVGEAWKRGSTLPRLDPGAGGRSSASQSYQRALRDLDCLVYDLFFAFGTGGREDTRQDLV